MALPGWLKEDIAKQDWREARDEQPAPLPHDVAEALRCLNRFIVRAMVPLSWTARPSLYSVEPGALARALDEERRRLSRGLIWLSLRIQRNNARAARREQVAA